MEEAVGVVTAVSSKVLDSGTYYSFCIDDVWYRTGRDPVPFEKGYTVKFEFDDGKYGKQVDLDTLKSKEGKAPAKSNGAAGGLSKNQYWDNKEARDIEKDKSIRMAGALNTAIAMVNGALAVECLTLPKGKVAARFDAYVAMVQEEADHLYAVIAETPSRHEELMQGDIGAEQDTTDFSDLEVEQTGPETDEWS